MSVFLYKKFNFVELPETVVLSNKQVTAVNERQHLSALAVGDKVKFIKKDNLTGEQTPIILTIKSIVSSKFMGF